MNTMTVRAFCARAALHLDLETRVRLGPWSFDEIQRHTAIRRTGLPCLGRSLAPQRLPGLIAGHDGRLFGCGGEHGDTRLFAYDRASGRFSDFGPLLDAERNEACRPAHRLNELRPGPFHSGETDNLARAGYLWECRLKP